jgi:hypothetical protein
MNTTKPCIALQKSRARLILAIVLPLSMQLVFLMVSPPTRADLVYTWHETDQQMVTGTLDVSPQALVTGSISFADIESFSFAIPGFSFLGSALFSTPYPIDASGIVTSPSTILESQNKELFVIFDSHSFNPTHPAGWSSITDAGVAFGDGYWTVSNTSVPEPSSLLLLSVGAVSGIAYGRVRQRRRARRRRAADHPQPTQ